MRKVKHVLSVLFAVLVFIGTSGLLYHFVILPRRDHWPAYATAGLQGVAFCAAMLTLNFCASRGWYQIDDAFSKPFQLFTKPSHIAEREKLLAQQREQIISEARAKHSVK